MQGRAHSICLRMPEPGFCKFGLKLNSSLMLALAGVSCEGSASDVKRRSAHLTMLSRTRFQQQQVPTLCWPAGSSLQLLPLRCWWASSVYT